jgi:hypothetical protein
MGHWLLTGWPFVGLAIATVLLAILVRPQPGRPWLERWTDARWLLWLGVPVYMLHQFEEHGIDLLGRRFAFGAEMCGTLGYGADLSACPADPAFLLAVNVGTVWVVGLAGALAGPRRAMVGLCAYAVPLVNAVAHIAPAVARRQYNPGLATAIVLFLPVSAWVIRTFWRQRLVDGPRLGLAIFMGVALHASLMGSLLAAGAGTIGRPTLLALQLVNAVVLVVVGLCVPNPRP